MKRNLLIVLLILTGLGAAQAKTEKFGTWVELEFAKKFFKKFEFSFIPDVRFQDDFTVDKYQFDGKLSYEPIKFLEFAAIYRVKTNVKNKENEVTHRMVLDATGKVEIGRFKPSFRARYVSYHNVDDKKVSTLRPRIKVVYDIKGNKIAPYTSYELFQNLVTNELEKGRFDVGCTRKIGKLHRIGVYYRLQDYYNTNNNSLNILGIDYRFKI